jgi:hypothetical protein
LSYPPRERDRDLGVFLSRSEPLSLFLGTAHSGRVGCQVHFGVPFAASKTLRSVVLAVSNSTTKKINECIKVKILVLTISAFLVKRCKSWSTAENIRIKARTPRRLVPIAVSESSSLPIGGNGTDQLGFKAGSR